MGAFFVRMLFWQLFSSYMYVEKAAKMMLYEKFVCKMLMKLTAGKTKLNNCGEKDQKRK